MADEGSGGGGGGGGDSPPWGLKWRSKPAFIVATVALGLFVDLFLYGLVIPVIPFMLQERLNVPKSMVQTYSSGLLAVYAASSAIFSVVVGVLADKTSKRQGPYLFGLLALAAATVMLALGKSLPVLFVARTLQGLSAAIVWTVGLAVVLDTVGPSNLGKVMGTIFSFTSLGDVLAPVLGGILYDKTGYTGVFGLALSLIFVDVVLRFLMIERKVAAKYDKFLQDQATNPRDFGTRAATGGDEENDSEEDALLPKDDEEKYKIPEGQNRIIRSGPILYCFRHPGFVMGLTLIFMQALILGSFEATIPTEAADLFGFGSLESGLLFIALDIPVLLFGIVGGWIVDKYGTKPATLIGYALIIPPLLLLRLPSAEILHGKDNIILYCAILFLAGMGAAMITSPGIVEATDVVQRYDKANPQFFGDNGPYAQLYGLNSLMYSAGLSVGPELSGVLRDQIGYGNMNSVLAAIAAVAAILSFFFVGGTARINTKKKTIEIIRRR